MTGAGRLSSGLQPVTANAAPLWLSCTVDRRRQCVSTLAAAPSGMEARRVKSRRKPGSAQTEKWHPQERELSDAEGGTRDRVQRRDRLRGHPGQGQ